MLGRKSLFITSISTICFILLALTACEPEEPEPAPTIISLFATTTPLPTFTPRPTSTPFPTITPSPRPIYRLETIYGDRLAPGWTFENSVLTSFDPDYKDYFFDGSRGIKVQQRDVQDIRGARFMVTYSDPDSPPLLHEDIISIRIRISGGENEIGPADLAIAMQGSLENSYWIEDDLSSRLTPGYIFQETQIVFFGVNTNIPAYEWVELEIFLDELQFDPPSLYFTGLYIVDRSGFLEPYYVDKIEIYSIAGYAED